MSDAHRIGLRRCLLLVLALPLALGLVVAAPGRSPVYALAVPPAPVVIEGAIKAAPRAVNVCVAGPVGAAICGGALLGFALYQTRDSWLPIAQDILNGDWLGNGGASISTQYDLGLTGVTLLSDNSVAGTGAVTPSVSGGTSLTINASQISCWSVATGAYTVVNKARSFPFTAVAGSRTSMSLVTPKLCPQGQTVVNARVIAQWGGGESDGVVVGGEYPDSAHATTTTTTCKRAGGTGSTFDISASIEGRSDRVPYPSCEAAEAGSIPWSTVIKGGPDGSTPRTYGTVTTKPDFATQFPDCFGPSGLLCDIHVNVDGVPCAVGQAECVDWDALRDTQPQRVECKFGSYTVGMGECSVLKRAYSTKVVVKTVTATGAPDYAPAPGGTTSLIPDSFGCAFQPAGCPAPVVPLDPVEPQVSQQDCLGGVTAFNPVSWVLVPVKCALRWAFVPPTSLSVRADRLKDTASGKFPFSLLSGLGGLAAAVPSASCPDWVIEVGPVSQNVVCDSSYTQAIRNMRPVFLVFMWVTALWPMIRSVAYASFPMIKPVPTR